MTQPTVHFDDSFPPPQVSEIRELTAAIRDLAEAIRQDPDSPTSRVSVNAPKGGLAGDFSPEMWRDPNIEHVDPDSPEAVEAFWGDGGSVDQAWASRHELRPTKTLDDVPEGWVAVLDSPRRLSPAAMRDAFMGPNDEPVIVEVRREVEDTHFGFEWSLVDVNDSVDDVPWGGYTETVTSLGLTYADFHPPA